MKEVNAKVSWALIITLIGLAATLGGMGLIMPWQSASRQEVQKIADDNNREHGEFKITNAVIKTSLDMITEQQKEILKEIRRRNR